MQLKLSKGKKCPWETKELSLARVLACCRQNWLGEFAFSRDWWLEPALLQQGRDPAWRGVMGINALVKMGNLEKVWVISCLSLPSYLGAIIPGNGMG